MKLKILLPFFAFGLGCDILNPPVSPPPPPPAPPAEVVQALPAEVTPALPAEVTPALPLAPLPAATETAAATLLPPPWGDLGFAYGNAAVLHSDAGTVVLTLPSTATAEIEALYAAWEQSLVAQGFAAGPAYINGLDAGEPWSKGARRVSIAHGVVGTSAYLYAEDLQKGSVSAVERRSVDESVSALMKQPAAKSSTTEAAAPSATKQADHSQGVGMTPGSHRNGDHKGDKDKKGKKDGKKKKGD